MQNSFISYTNSRVDTCSEVSIRSIILFVSRYEALLDNFNSGFLHTRHLVFIKKTTISIEFEALVAMVLLRKLILHEICPHFLYVLGKKYIAQNSSAQKDLFLDAPTQEIFFPRNQGYKSAQNAATKHRAFKRLIAILISRCVDQSHPSNETTKFPSLLTK